MMAIHGRTKDCSLEKRESWGKRTIQLGSIRQNLRGKKFYFRRQFLETP